MLRALVLRFRNWIFLFFFSGVSTIALVSGSGPSPSAGRDLDFARDIRPILEANCNQCHGADRSMNGLRLDTRESALKGGQSGPAILPGDGSSSLLYRKIVGDAPGSPMPLTGKLPPDQGVQIRSQGDPVLFLSDPEWMTRKARSRSLDSLKNLNQLQYQAVGDPEILTRIASYELAYRMQTSVPELMDISDEPEHIHRMYGTEPGKESFANNCLLARRLVERGVRFVQLYHHGWDHHGYLAQMSIIHKEGLQTRCRETDQASAALIKDLKDRGLLEDTLVVWGGEFGRTPMNEQPGKYPGRDHHPYAFTMWLAGGGTKPGITVGKTDELGYEIAEDPVHLHDLHATILHSAELGPHPSGLQVPGTPIPAHGRGRPCRGQVVGLGEQRHPCRRQGG